MFLWGLHGNLGSPADWSAAADCLRPLRLTATRLWDPPPQAFSGWARSFLAEVNREPGDGRVVMGYSLGARLAMHAVLERPDAWAAAVFVSGHPGLEAPEERERRLRADLEWAGRLRQGTVAQFLAGWNAQSVFGEGPPPPDQLETVERHRAAIAAAFDCWSLGRQEFLGDRLRACPVPQLWVAGERDVKFAALARAMATGAGAGEGAGASAAILGGCGHRVLLQKPRALAECVRSFLERCNPNTRDVEASG